MSPTPAVQLVTMGETLAALSSRRPRPLRHATSLDLSIGGAESNAAIAAARLGVRTAWVGRVGDDEFGRMVVRELTGEGIDVRAVVDEEHPTAVMLKSHRTSSRMTVDYYRKKSAGSHLCVEDLDLDLIRAASVFHVSAITPALSSSARDAVHLAISVAKEAGVTVSIDLNYRAALWTPVQASPEFQALAATADVVFATVQEAQITVPGSTPEELGARLSALGAGEVVIKLGAQGAVCWERGIVTAVAPFPAVAIDDVGAGDAFAAGYLTSLITGGNVEQRLEWAAALGSWAVSTEGDWEGAPSLKELGDFLEGRDCTDSVAR